MSDRGRPWVAFVALAAVVIVGPFVIDPLFGSLLLGWAGFGLVAAAAGTAWVAYGATRNPAMLYVAACAAAATAQAFVTGVWLGSIDSASGQAGTLIAYGDVVWSVVLAAGLLLVAPWRDRRGRAPAKPRQVLVWAFGAVALADLALLAAGSATGKVASTRAVVGFVLAVVFFVAGFRAATGGRFATVSWFSAAAFAAGIAELARSGYVGREPIFTTIASPVQGAATACLGAFLLVGVLTAVRVEASRARREGDRAAEVLGGREEVASMLAHEVRGPVATVKSLAATTLQSYERLSDDERKEFVELIEQESSRLLQTVTQASLAMKVDAESLRFDLRPVDVAEVVREAAAVGGPPVDLDVPAGLRARADRRWLAEALAQALSNARKYAPEGSPVRVAATGGTQSVTIEIADAGPGIPPDKREEVFGRFVTWRPVGYEERAGSGLGLFICRGLIREQGGDVRVEDAPQGGTMLRITLPQEG